MRVVDPGHRYELAHLDGHGVSVLTFVKREGQGYPGNVGHWEGTNIQEVLRALLDRVSYLNHQAPDDRNDDVADDLRNAIYSLEVRAAERHGRLEAFKTLMCVESSDRIEQMPTCGRCGHIACAGTCHQAGE